jgi:NAD(P)-dependent dehydrogenase (short-subunit alcohol dehydrogenase family)
MFKIPGPNGLLVRSSATHLGQLARISPHDPACRETDVETEVWVRCDHHGSLADSPIARVNASVSMITKGGLNTLTRRLATEYAKEGTRFNAEASGAVDTALHKDDPKDALRQLQPMGKIATVQDIVEAVLYFTHACHVTGEVLHVDGGAHTGRW